ncbi:MAG TPA: TIGR01777 family oxidoreductase [Rectinemataceae bacterium]|nr:TIGR01777 family oxidoreductase [Rectinemataceae bacterium]
MKVVIAGGSGYLGEKLAGSWSARGAELIVLTRGRAEARPGDPPGLHRVAWDGRTVKDWVSSLEGADIVVNLAGERVAGSSLRYRWSGERKRLLASSRVDAGRALVAGISAITRRPSVFVQASGIDYYASGEALATEEAIHGESFLSRLVSHDWEPSTAAVEALGLRRLILRIAPVIGSGSPVLAPLVLQHRLYIGGPVGGGGQWFPWISIEDLVGSLHFLVDHDNSSGSYNLVSPGSVRNAELSSTLGKVLGRPSWLPIPALVLRLALGEMADTLLEGVRANPKRLLEEGYRFIHSELRTALEAALRSVA